MFTHARMFALATATAVVMPALATAATTTFSNDLDVDRFYSYAHVLSPGDTVEFRFTVLSDMFIDGFSLSATGNSSESDVRNIRYGFVEPLTGAFTTIASVAGVAAAFGFLPGETYAMGDVFSIMFDDGITNSVAVTLSFGTESVAPIPIPAAGALLAPFLLLGGLIGARRRKRSASMA